MPESLSRGQRFAAWCFAFIIAVWAMAVISYAVWATFRDIALINAAVVSALSAVLGIPTGAAALAAMVRRRRRLEASDVG